MRHNFFDHINIDLANTNVPCGVNPNAEEECARYDQIIRSLGGIDVQVLGLGPNGHIGFNEPDDCFTKGTHQGGPDRRHHPGLLFFVFVKMSAPGDIREGGISDLLFSEICHCSVTFLYFLFFLFVQELKHFLRWFSLLSSRG